MMLIAEDCMGTALSGVTFTSAQADKSTVQFYVRDLLPSTTAKETAEVGNGGYLNFPAGTAVLNVKLAHLGPWTSARRANAARYAERLTAAGLDRHIVLPREAPAHFHVWNQYTIRIPGGRRDTRDWRIWESAPRSITRCRYTCRSASAAWAMNPEACRNPSTRRAKS